MQWQECEPTPRSGRWGTVTIERTGAAEGSCAGEDLSNGTAGGAPMSDHPSPRRAPAASPHSTTPPVAGGITRRRVLQGAAGAAVVATTGWPGRAAAQSPSLPFACLNLSGLASNSYVENAGIGTHYRAITAQHVAAAGNGPFFRLPTTAARFTRGQGAPLNESYCKQVQDALDNIAARGKRAIVELHDYMRLPQRVAAKS